LDESVKEIIVRVIAGGLVVTAFSILGSLLKPKSFAGLFGAAPSVALATLFLTVSKDGKAYASLEARSMILGAIAFIAYALVVSRTLIRRRWPALATTAVMMTVWFGCAFGLLFAFRN
jgi:hydrogenase-4 membrane subunit HyfE